MVACLHLAPRATSHALDATADLCRPVLAAAALAETQVAELGATCYLMQSFLIVVTRSRGSEFEVWNQD